MANHNFFIENIDQRQRLEQLNKFEENASSRVLDFEFLLEPIYRCNSLRFVIASIYMQYIAVHTLPGHECQYALD